MKKNLVSIALTIIVGLTTIIGTTAHAGNDAKTEKSLLKIEQEANDAWANADVAALERIEAEDYLLIDGSGQVITKTQLLADFKSGALKIVSITLEDTKVRIYGDAAVVTGVSTVKGTYKEQDISGKYRVTDVFVKQKGAWKLVTSQGTVLAPAK